jgi:hypothetical protein
MKKPAKNTSPDWTEMYRLELGIDPSKLKKFSAVRNGGTPA